MTVPSDSARKHPAVLKAGEYISAVQTGDRDRILPFNGPTKGGKSPKTVEQYQSEICSFDYGKRTTPLVGAEDMAFDKMETREDDSGDWHYVTFKGTRFNKPHRVTIGMLELRSGDTILNSVYYRKELRSCPLQWFVCDISVE